MSFIWPGMLWFLLLAPALAGAYILAQRRRQKYALRYASLSLVKEALGKGPGRRRHVPAVLFIIGTVVMIAALARPSASVTLPSQQGTVVLALDVSGSMRAEDIKPSRMDAVKSAAKSFIGKQPRHVRIAVVSFSGNAALVQPPTTDKDQLLAAVDRLRPQRYTAIGNAILTSLDAIFENMNVGGQSDRPAQDPMRPLAPAPPDQPTPAAAPGSYTSAAIVLLSDGQSNQGPDPLDAADKAANLGVRVFTVGVGTPQGAVIGFEGFSFRVMLDEAALKQIANKTGGSYYRAGSESELRNVYNTLSTRLMLEKEKTEITAIFAGVALALMLAAGGLSLLWFSRLP
jgi:Ca-activated chloride channel family protein